MLAKQILPLKPRTAPGHPQSNAWPLLQLNPNEAPYWI